MIVNCVRGLWLSNPAAALTLNPDNPAEFFQQVVVSGEPEDTGMETYGWVKLGTTTVGMRIELSHKDILNGSLKACQQKLAEMDAEHQRKRMVMQEAISKLQSIGWSGSRP